VGFSLQSLTHYQKDLTAALFRGKFRVMELLAASRLMQGPWPSAIFALPNTATFQQRVSKQQNSNDSHLFFDFH
jgi:hypothetical protein